MRITKKDLILQKDNTLLIDEALKFDLSGFTHRLNGLREVKDVWVKGFLKFDENSQLVLSDLDVKTNLIVGCAITDEDVDVPIETSVNETFSFNTVSNPDVIVAKGETIDLGNVIFQSILSEVPLKVVKPNLNQYPKGDGWEVLTQQEYESQPKPIDSRLAKLKEFQIK